MIAEFKDKFNLMYNIYLKFTNPPSKIEISFGHSVENLIQKIRESILPCWLAPADVKTIAAKLKVVYCELLSLQ